MSTITARKQREHYDIILGNLDKVHDVLRLVFGMEGANVHWLVDESGYHLAASSEDGYAFITAGQWTTRDLRMDHLPMVAEAIVAWLKGLSTDDRRQLCGSVPMEETYMRDPGITFGGFRALSERSDDGQHYMLTIIPHWA